uniref:dihydrofolate reductase family protein n=1 Tax=Thaumasiovibrio occultus TaxID=1891184 RepID=UPI000B35BE0C|nr:dihydrofolate reductase family protein [Thaumasiovibrio occultus]
MSNTVYIATSLDGYIADKDGKVDWLHAIPNPTGSDMGFADFMARIDAIVMGRNTFETVVGFDVPWPYDKPVFVLSNTLKTVPDALADKVQLIAGELDAVVSELNAQGYQHLYIDGGKTVQSFLRQDRIDELIIATLPVVLGGGIPLFSALPAPLHFKLVKTQTHLDAIVQSFYQRATD